MLNGREALLVQVFLRSAVVRGLAEIAEGRRLGDLLNGIEESIELESATFSFAARDLELESFVVEKREIVAAIPWETRDQHRQRRIASFAGRTRTLQVPVIVAAPPYAIEGSAHFANETSLPRTISASPGVFPRFFPLTGARIIRDDGRLVRSEIVVVNRDLVAGIGRPRGAERT